MARAKFYDAVVKLAVVAGLEDLSFNVSGDPLRDRFERTFVGAYATAKSRCPHLYCSLRLGKVRWNEQSVLDGQRQEVYLFVLPDKNSAQVWSEALAKNFKEVLDRLMPSGKEVWCKEPAGTLLVDHMRLVSVHLCGEDSSGLRWNRPKGIELKIKQSRI